MRPAILKNILSLLALLAFFGCRDEVVEELESYGVKREWIPFAPGHTVDKNYMEVFVEGASPWLTTQVVAVPYTVALSPQARSGKKALKITTAATSPGPIWITRYEDLSDLLGKKIRFSGYVKAVDWNGTVEAGYMSDNMPDDIKKISFTEPLTKNTWTRFSTDIDIPMSTQYLGLVLQLEGTGTVYMDDCEINVIGVSDSGAAPRDVRAIHSNLGFEDGDNFARRSPYEIADSLIFRMPFWRTDYHPEEYKLLLDSSEPHTGSYAAGFRSSIEQPRGSTVLIREIEPELVKGHRVRFTVWVKSKDLTGLPTFQAVWRGENMFGAEVKRLWEVGGTSDWKQFALEADVPDEVVNLRVDVGYSGTGTLLVDDLAIERLNKLPKTNDLVDKSEYFAKPLNLGFENE
jgi:hypothetical protein